MFRAAALFDQAMMELATLSVIENGFIMRAAPFVAIVPWNGQPFAATMMLAPGLAAGNYIVLKAPELAPWAVMRLGELLLEAGFPTGVINFIAGGADVGAAMVAHPGIDKIQFVGSGATAKTVLRSATGMLKPRGLELGGKSAVIVFADADLQEAARHGLSSRVAGMVDVVKAGGRRHSCLHRRHDLWRAARENRLF